MFNLCPLVDCLQVPLDEEYNKIIIYTYIDNPIKFNDRFKEKDRQDKLKEYDTSDEFPLYLNIELWEWQGDTYIKKAMKEIMLKRETTQIITEKYLRFAIRSGKLLKFISHGEGSKWKKGWTVDEN